MSQSLGHISTSAALVIRSSDVALVYVLGFLLLSDTFTLVRSVAVLLAVAGVVVTGLDKEFAGSAVGVALVIASSLFAATYKVLLKKVVGNATLGQVSLFMSSMGLLNLVANSAPALGMIQSGVDRMQFNNAPWTPIILSSWLALGKVFYPDELKELIHIPVEPFQSILAFNFLTNFGIALLDPLVISIGMLCGLPLSALIDIVFRSKPASPMFAVGSALISLSFILIAMPVAPHARGRQGEEEEKIEEVSVRLTDATVSG